MIVAGRAADSALLLLALAQNRAFAAGDDSTGASARSGVVGPLTSGHAVSALLQRKPAQPEFTACRVRWTCVKRACRGVADERFDGCKMIRSCFELRRLLGADNGIVAYSAGGHPIEASRLQLYNHPQMQAAHSLIP